jgi:hypothetical protein
MEGPFSQKDEKSIQASYSVIQLGKWWNLKFHLLYILDTWNHLLSLFDEPDTTIYHLPIIYGPHGFTWCICRFTRTLNFRCDMGWTSQFVW